MWPSTNRFCRGNNTYWQGPKPITLVKYNICNGLAGHLELALHATGQMRLDLGILMKTKLTDHIYTRTHAGFNVNISLHWKHSALGIWGHTSYMVLTAWTYSANSTRGCTCSGEFHQSKWGSMQKMMKPQYSTCIDINMIEATSMRCHPLKTLNQQADTRTPLWHSYHTETDRIMTRIMGLLNKNSAQSLWKTWHNGWVSRCMVLMSWDPKTTRGRDGPIHFCAGRLFGFSCQIASQRGTYSQITMIPQSLSAPCQQSD